MSVAYVRLYVPLPPIFSPKQSPVNNENINVNELVIGTARDMSIMFVLSIVYPRTTLQILRIPDLPNV